MTGRVDVHVISGNVRYVCQEIPDWLPLTKWKCARCGRGVVARRFPDLLWHIDACRVCHRKVEVIDHGYPAPAVPIIDTWAP